MERTPLELAESIDQSRIIARDVRLRGIMFSKGDPDINGPREVEVVERYLSEGSRQQAALRGF